MTAAIEPLAPGTRPTEPGWYVYDSRHFGRQIMRVVIRDGHPYEETPGSKETMVPVGNLTFIARIYPDRIGQEPVDTSAGIPIYDEHGRPFEPLPKPEEW